MILRDFIAILLMVYTNKWLFQTIMIVNILQPVKIPEILKMFDFARESKPHSCVSASLEVCDGIGKRGPPKKADRPAAVTFTTSVTCVTIFERKIRSHGSVTPHPAWQ